LKANVRRKVGTWSIRGAHEPASRVAGEKTLRVDWGGTEKWKGGGWVPFW